MDKKIKYNYLVRLSDKREEWWEEITREEFEEKKKEEEPSTVLAVMKSKKAKKTEHMKKSDKLEYYGSILIMILGACLVIGLIALAVFGGYGKV